MLDATDLWFMNLENRGLGYFCIVLLTDESII
jgi:hypothetical protein